MMNNYDKPELLIYPLAGDGIEPPIGQRYPLPETLVEHSWSCKRFKFQAPGRFCEVSHPFCCVFFPKAPRVRKTWKVMEIRWGNISEVKILLWDACAVSKSARLRAPSVCCFSPEWSELSPGTIDPWRDSCAVSLEFSTFTCFTEHRDTHNGCPYLKTNSLGSS